MDWKGDVGEAMKIFKDAAPTLETDIPAIGPFLPLLNIALAAVVHVQQATGATTAAAVEKVAMHLTPGMANAPALRSDAATIPEGVVAVAAATKAAAGAVRSK